MLLIQLLGIQWTKKDRNIEATRERASLPTASSFQTSQLPSFGECWVQSSKTQRVDWTDRVQAGLAEVVRLDEETIRVGLAAGHRTCSLERIEQCEPFVLKLGETVQFFTQFRAQYYDDMWFERQIANVAWLRRFDSEVFRLRPFTHQYRFRSPLA